MTDKKERKNKQGMLLGPARADKYLEWRRARNNAIANPRRLKTCKDEKKTESPDQPGEKHG